MPTLYEILERLNLGFKPRSGTYGPPDVRGKGQVDPPRKPAEAGAKGRAAPGFEEKLRKAEEQYQRETQGGLGGFWEGVKKDLSVGGIYAGLGLLVLVGLLFVGLGGVAGFRK